MSRVSVPLQVGKPMFKFSDLPHTLKGVTVRSELELGLTWPHTHGHHCYSQRACNTSVHRHVTHQNQSTDKMQNEEGPSPTGSEQQNGLKPGCLLKNGTTREDQGGVEGNPCRKASTNRKRCWKKLILHFRAQILDETKFNFK